MRRHMNEKKHSKIVEFLRTHLASILAALAFASFIISVLLYTLGETKGDRTLAFITVWMGIGFALGGLLFLKWRSR